MIPKIEELMGIEVLPIDGAMSVEEGTKPLAIEVLAIDGKKAFKKQPLR